MRDTVACLTLHRLVLVAGGFGCVGVRVGVADLGLDAGRWGKGRVASDNPAAGAAGRQPGRDGGTDQGGGIEQAAARALVMACSNWSRSDSHPRALLGRRKGGIRWVWCWTACIRCDSRRRMARAT